VQIVLNNLKEIIKDMVSKAHEFAPGELENFYSIVLDFEKKLDKSADKQALSELNKIKVFRDGIQAVKDYIEFYTTLIKIIFKYAKVGGKYEFKLVPLMKERAKAELDWPDIYNNLNGFIDLLLKTLKESLQKNPETGSFIAFWTSGENKKFLQDINTKLELVQSYIYDISKLFTEGTASDFAQKVKHSTKELFGGKYKFNLGALGSAIESLESKPMEIIQAYFKAWGIKPKEYLSSFDTLVKHAQSNVNNLKGTYNKIFALSKKSATSLDPEWDLGKFAGLQVCMDLGYTEFLDQDKGLRKGPGIAKDIQIYVNYFDALYRLEKILVNLAKILVSSGKIGGIGYISRIYKMQMINVPISMENTWRAISDKLEGLIKKLDKDFKRFSGEGAVQIRTNVSGLKTAYKDLDQCMFWLYELLR